MAQYFVALSVCLFTVLRNFRKAVFYTGKAKIKNVCGNFLKIGRFL